MDQPYCLQRARFYGSYGMETSQVSAAQDATNRCASPLHADLDLQPNFPKPLLPPMNKSTLHEMFRCETKIQIPRSIWLPALLRWALGLAVLIVPQAGRALEWHATVGAQSSDKGHQALAFLPNEIWINKEDSITWTIDVDEPHTVTFNSL
jgi:hypothetical protein